MGKEEYFGELSRVAERLRGRAGEEVAIVFHNDADGLCAGAIASLALKRAGVKYKPISIEKIHPAILRLVHSSGHKLYIYLDIGSGRADLVAEAAEESGSEAVILDHHDPRRVESSRVVSLNPELYGFSGESEVSGSTATYLSMREVSKLKDAAWMAVVGSAEIPGPLQGLNRIPLEDAISVGDVEVRESGGKERYYIKFLRKPWSKVSSTLTAIGSVGYYRGGPYQAVEYLLSRSIDEGEAARLEEERKKRFRQAFAVVARRRLKTHGRVQWFHLGSLFKGLGTKTLGTFTSMLSYRGIVQPDRYLVGFMEFEPELPGLGRVEGEWVKVSVRTPKKVSEEVRAGRLPPASELTVKASEEVGGTGDGHSFAASALIPAGEEERFIEIFDGLIGG